MASKIHDSVVVYASRREFWDAIQQGNKPLQKSLVFRMLSWVPVVYLVIGVFAWIYVNGSDKPKHVKDMVTTAVLLLVLICVLALFNSVCLRCYYRLIALVPFLHSDIPILEEYTSTERLNAKQVPLLGVPIGLLATVSGLGLFCSGSSLDRISEFVIWECGMLFGVLVIGMAFDSQIRPLLSKLEARSVSVGQAKRLIAIFSLSKITHPLLLIMVCLIIGTISDAVALIWNSTSAAVNSAVSFAHAIGGVCYLLCGCFAVVTGLLPMWYVMPSKRFRLYVGTLVGTCIVGLIGGWRIGLMAAVLSPITSKPTTSDRIKTNH